MTSTIPCGRGQRISSGVRNMDEPPRLHLDDFDLGILPARPPCSPLKKPLPTEGCVISAGALVFITTLSTPAPIRAIDTHGYGFALFGGSYLYAPFKPHPASPMSSNVNIPGIMTELIYHQSGLCYQIHEAARDTSGVSDATVTSCILEQTVIVTPCGIPLEKVQNKIHPAVSRDLDAPDSQDEPCSYDFVVIVFPCLLPSSGRVCSVYVQVETPRGPTEHELQPGQVALLPKQDVLNLRLRSSKPLLFCIIGTFTVHVDDKLEWLPDEAQRFKWYHIKGRPPVRWPPVTNHPDALQHELSAGYHRGVNNPVPFRLEVPQSLPPALLHFNRSNPSVYSPLRFRSGLVYLCRDMWPRNGYLDVCEWDNQYSTTKT